MEVQKISAGTIARLVLLLIALVNSALTAAEKAQYRLMKKVFSNSSR
ncbi:hypothetical protein ACEQPO_25605 [Bacillus sp. SL00103]